MKNFFALVLVVVTTTVEAQREVDGAPSDGSQSDPGKISDEMSKHILIEENKSSKPETQGRYQPINKGIEETPVNIRDAQDFPNNI
tara:strand:- start:50 stop:307 length:258 start_codon:yes stop_codon:yes gene_type:complete